MRSIKASWSREVIILELRTQASGSRTGGVGSDNLISVRIIPDAKRLECESNLAY